MKKNVIKSTIILFILCLIAKGIGFIKSIVMAAYFGSDIMSDAYYCAASLMNNVVYMITMSIGISSLPIYISLRDNKGRHEAKKFVGDATTFLSILSIVISIVLILIAPLLIRLVAPSYEGLQYNNTVLFLRIMCLGIVFSLVSNIYQNVLDAEKIYLYANLPSIVNSCVLMIMIIFLGKQYGIVVAAIAIPFSYFAQFLMLRWRSREFTGKLLKKINIDVNIKLLIGQAFPVLVSNAAIELNQLVDCFLLTSVGVGAISAINYAAVLYQFSVHMISIPISTVAYTEFSIMSSNEKYDDMELFIRRAFRIIVLISIPISIIMFISSTDIVDIVYGRGAFDETAIMQTAIGVSYYAFCIIPTSINQVLNRAFYSLKDTKIPMYLGFFGVVANVVLSIILTQFLGMRGVILGTAIAGTICCLASIVTFHVKKYHINFGYEKKEYSKIFISLIITIVVLLTVNGKVQNVLASLLLNSTISIFVFFGILIFLREQIVLWTCKELLVRLGTFIKKNKRRE